MWGMSIKSSNVQLRITNCQLSNVRCQSFSRALYFFEDGANEKTLIMEKVPQPAGGNHRHYRLLGVETIKNIKR